MATSDLVKPTGGHLGKVVNAILSLLEKLADENLWKSFLGDRLVNLGQKYFGNDFVTISLAFYLAPILQTHWQNLVAMIFTKIQSKKRVTVTIDSYNGLYDDISKYIFANSPSRGKMNTGILEYRSSSLGKSIDTDFYGPDFFDTYERDERKVKEDDDEEHNPGALKVELLPPNTYTEDIEYKGHIITANFVESNNDINEHLELSMEAPDTKLLHVIIEEWTNRVSSQQERGYLYRVYGSSWQYEREIPERDFESVHLCAGQKEKLIQDMKMFRKKADWYHKRGIAHRRGYLLYGPPGTGKTSTIQAVATLLHLNVAIANLSSISNNDDLNSLVSQLPANSIMVMEDIDHLFKANSEDSSNPSTLTMSGLLNVLDGMQGSEGSMVFMTCNTIEKIEPALLRPGRIDLKLKLDYAQPEQIRGTFLRFMNLDDSTSLPLEDEDRAKVEELAEKFTKVIPAGYVTTAEVQSYFIDIILEANSNGWEKEEVYKNLFDRVPQFLEKVELDRIQAKNHKAKNNAEKGEKVDKVEEKKDDELEKKKVEKAEEKPEEVEEKPEEVEEKVEAAADKVEEKAVEKVEETSDKKEEHVTPSSS